MPRPYERNTQSFVLRFWEEPLGSEEIPQWRGQIEHVGSCEQAFFEDSEGLLQCVARWMPGFTPGQDDQNTQEVQS